MQAVIYTSLGLMLIFGVSAVMLHSMIKSAIALAAGSVALGIIMFELGSVWAALFEISVCSGLVTVIFISAVSLSNMDKKEIEKLYKDRKRMSYLPVVLIAAGIALIVAVLSSGFPMSDSMPAVKNADNFREILWNNRQADIWGQIILVVTGAAAVVVLFRESD